MPYKVRKTGEKWETYNPETGKVYGEHSTRRQALIQPEKEELNANLVAGSIQFEADVDNPRFLKFRDAVLARAETNKNLDNVNEVGIEELASTIAGTAIDIDHDPAKNVGFYTAGRAENNELRVDGVLWLDRCEVLGVNPTEIIEGKYGLSIEAEAQTAQCSICETTHTSFTSYCTHLKNKMRYGATRFLSQLKAVGGALTKKPAGSGTGFSTMMLVASHEELEGCLDDGMPDSVETKEKVMEAEVEIEVEDKKEEEAENEELEAMKAECAKLTAELAELKASHEVVETGKVAVEAKLAEVETQLVNANTEVETLKTSLETASNQLKAHREQEVKSMLVGSVMDESEFEAQKATLVALPNDVLALMGRKSKVEDKPRMMAAVETHDDKIVKIVL
jgi:hypothetical protein